MFLNDKKTKKLLQQTNIKAIVKLWWNYQMQFKIVNLRTQNEVLVNFKCFTFVRRTHLCVLKLNSKVQQKDLELVYNHVLKLKFDYTCKETRSSFLSCFQKRQDMTYVDLVKLTLRLNVELVSNLSMRSVSRVSCNHTDRKKKKKEKRKTSSRPQSCEV